MGVEMNLDTENNWKLDLSPNTVLPPLCQCLEPDRKYAKASLREDELLRVKDGFTEISFRRYRSASCKNARSRSLGLDGHVELRRGSVYQSSKEVRKLKKIGNDEGRRKIEFSSGSDTSFSSAIVDSLCSSDEDSPKESNVVTCARFNGNVIAASNHNNAPCSIDGFIEICLNSDNRRKGYINPIGIDTKDTKVGCNAIAGPLSEERTLPEKDTASTLYQSLSAKVEVPHSPSSSESDRSCRANSRTRFSPIRKMFDPFRKSKSLRSPLGYGAEAMDVKISGMDDMGRNRTVETSLLPDFLNTTHDLQLNSQFIKRDPYCSVVASSPVHLHGCLKLQNKNGCLSFELSMDRPEDVLVAKTWKRDKAFNWVYTFHSAGSRKKSNASIWNSNDSCKEPSIVGQMQVSSYLCSEVKSSGIFYDSMVTEFVLYDIAHARKSLSLWQSDNHMSPSNSSPDLVKVNCRRADGSDTRKVETRSNDVSGNGDFVPSNESNQRPSIHLHPNLETAAIVIQGPIEKRERLKYRRGGKGGEKGNSDLINLSSVGESKRASQDTETHDKLTVVIPTGFHGLPRIKSPGPSSLLDRWRLGGGCDCGGWDIACPLIVLDNPSIKCSDDQPYVDAQSPFQLFLQGTKETLPALTMTLVGEGEYAIDFHAQLSRLQAFSICVALLHGTETSAAAGKEQSIELPQCNSLKMLLEEEVKFLIRAVTEEKKKVGKKVEEIPASYVLNPPFSPIARV